MPTVTPEEQKAILKEAMQEWLDNKLKDFGWWTLKGIGALALAGLMYAAIKTGGFK